MNTYIFFFFLFVNVIHTLQLRNNIRKCLTIPLWEKCKNPKSFFGLPENSERGINILNNRFFRNELNIFKTGFNLFRKKYHERSIEEKLSTIPIYVISNFSNSPYIFQEKNKQVCYLFMCPHDAEEMLRQFLQNTNIKETNNIKIHSIHMGKVYQLIQEMMYLKSLENTNEHIKRNIVYWKLIPSKKQVQNSLVYLSFKKKTDYIFPVFYIKGLHIKKGKSVITPLFFSMEDLKYVIKNQCKESSITARDINVLNFMDLIFSEAHKHFGFVPSSESIEYAEKLKKIGIRKTTDL